MEKPQKSSTVKLALLHDFAAREEATQAGHDRCVLCDEGITNPICPECVEKQIQAFFGEKTGRTNLFAKRLAMGQEHNLHNSSWCIICGNKMAVCSHCYSSDVFSELKENYPQLASQFQLHFNYYLNG